MNRQLRNPAPARWDFLAEVLPHGIEPTDIDLCIERRGQFLILEGKRPNESIPRGQERFLSALDSKPGFTVIQFEGHPPVEVTGYRLWRDDHMTRLATQDFRGIVRQWFDWVEAQGGT